ncbi:MAG: nitrilase family protein [Bacteroidales bacterium]|nr:nitrilase family protein [Bacteroidales bacterium]
MNELNITFYQQDIVWGDAEANRHAVEERMRHCDIFVVPETFTTGFGDHMASLAEEQEGPTLQWARKMAAKHDFLFVGTWIVKDNNLCYNRLHWVYPDGSYGTYDKGHTFRVSGEADQIARGTRREVFEWRGWKIKPAVCYDLRFPKWLRNDNLDYDLLLICANWPGSRHEAWTTLLKARAIENQCYVLGCNRAGTDGANIPYTGNSALIDYKGFILAEADGEQAVNATIDKDKLYTFREHWPFYLDFD